MNQLTDYNDFKKIIYNEIEDQKDLTNFGYGGFYEEKIKSILNAYHEVKGVFKHNIGQHSNIFNFLKTSMFNTASDEVLRSESVSYVPQDYYKKVLSMGSIFKYPNIKLISESDEVKNIISETYDLVHTVQYSNYNLPLKILMSGDEHTLYIIQPKSQSEFSKAIEIKKSLLERGKSANSIKIIADEKSEFDLTEEQCEKYSNLEETIKNSVQTFARENDLFLQEKTPNKYVSKELFDEAGRVMSEVDKVHLLIPELVSKARSLFELGAISPQENNELKIIDNEQLCVIYYLHMAGQISVGLQAIRNVIPNDLIVEDTEVCCDNSNVSNEQVDNYNADNSNLVNNDNNMEFFDN